MPGQPEGGTHAARELGHALRASALQLVLRLGERAERLDRAEHHALHVVHRAHDFGIRPAPPHEPRDGVGDLCRVALVVFAERSRLVGEQQHAREATAVEHRHGELPVQRAGKPSLPQSTGAFRAFAKHGTLRAQAVVERRVGWRQAAPAREHRQVLRAGCAVAAQCKLELPGVGRREEDVSGLRPGELQRELGGVRKRLGLGVAVGVLGEFEQSGGTSQVLLRTLVQAAPGGDVAYQEHAAVARHGGGDLGLEHGAVGPLPARLLRHLPGAADRQAADRRLAGTAGLEILQRPAVRLAGLEAEQGVECRVRVLHLARGIDHAGADRGVLEGGGT